MDLATKSQQEIAEKNTVNYATIHALKIVNGLDMFPQQNILATTL